VLRTSGFCWNCSATNPSIAGQVITGALHLAFQTAGTAIGETAASLQNTLPNNQQFCRTAIGETAAEPRNICSKEQRPSRRKVQSTEI